MKAVRTTVMLTLVLAACGKKPTTEQPTKGEGRGGGGNRTGMIYAVDVMPIESKKLNYVVTAPGTVDAFEHVQVTARVAGAVDKVAFTEGQQVKKGDVLVVIDSQRYQVLVASAQAALDKAKAQQKDNEAQVARREGAAEAHPGLIPGEELESYKTKTLTAKADTQVALQALRTAQLNLHDSAVRAPMDGVIQTRTVETGQYVPTGYVMATLLKTDPMLLRFQVEPQEAPRLKPGMATIFTMRESQQTYTAKLTLVSASADAVTHMVPVTAQVNDDGHRFWLRPGSFCDVELDIGAQRDAPIIPRIAARATDHGYVAYVVKGSEGHGGGAKGEGHGEGAKGEGHGEGAAKPEGSGKPEGTAKPEIAEERVLTLGMSTKDGWIEVRSGLSAGELLVVHGAEALSSGAKVRANHVTAEAIMAAAAAAAGTATAPPLRPPASASAGGSASGAPHTVPARASASASASAGTVP